MGAQAPGLGFRVQGLGFRFQAPEEIGFLPGFRVASGKFRFRVYRGLGFRGLGFRF